MKTNLRLCVISVGFVLHAGAAGYTPAALRNASETPMPGSAPQRGTKRSRETLTLILSSKRKARQIPSVGGTPSASKSKKGAGRGERGLQEQMRSSVQEGLAQALHPSNKGLQIMQAMGYKGKGLGKHESGMEAPLALALDQGRQGLGLRRAEADAAARAARAEAQAKAAAAEAAADARAFHRYHMSSAFADRQAEADLRAAQLAVLALDEEAGCTGGRAMWPGQGSAQDAAVVGGGPVPDADVGDTLCGCSASAPPPVGGGEAEQAHGHAEQAHGQAEHPVWQACSTRQRLAAAEEYLRAVHTYCLWCAERFPDEAALHAACPGPGKAAH